MNSAAPNSNGDSPARYPRRTLVGGLALALVCGLVAWIVSGAIIRLEGPADHFRGALAAFEQNDLGQVSERMEVLRLVPDYTPHVHLLQGMLLLRSNQPVEEAMRELGLAKEHPQTAPWAYTLAGEILYKIGNLGGAVSVLQQAIVLDDQRTDAHRWLAAAYYDLGAMEEAVRHLAVVSELDLDDPRPNRLRGLIHKDYEKYLLAIEDYEESLRRQPGQKDVLFELAYCLAKVRQLDRALEILRECEATAEALTLAAECEYAQDNVEATRNLLDQAFQLPDPPTEAFQLRATLALDTRDVEQAAEVLEQGIAQYPKDFTLRFKLSQAYRRLGREAEAEEQAGLSEELRGLRYRFSELHEEAINKPLDPEVRYQLGLLAQQLEQPQLAVSWFRATLALDPHHQPAQQALESISP
jgi:tetratricopeptide (TPR) repeat protein